MFQLLQSCKKIVFLKIKIYLMQIADKVLTMPGEI